MDSDEIWNNTSKDSPPNKWEESQQGKEYFDSEAQCLLKNWYNESSDNHIKESEIFCSTVWDRVYCWPPTPSGSTLIKSCSEIFSKIYPNHSENLEGYVKRECLVNGTWAEGNESNYEECANSFKSQFEETEEDDVLFPMVHYMLFIGSILSLLCLGVSLAIFRNFRCLHCDRVNVQSHLMMSLILRFVLMFIITEPFVLGHNKSYRDVDILCESILVSFLYSTFTSVSWMFVQGLFLNVALMPGRVTISNRYQLAAYNIIGWGVPAFFTVVYVISMIIKEQERCWNGYSKMKEMWILLGPITFELVVNGIFLLNILRVLLRKVRNSNSQSDSSQLKAAAKATVVLFPVLGINNLVLLYNPGGDYNKYFVTVNTFFASTQGIFVAIVYCFADKEVRAAIRRSVERAKSRRVGNSSQSRNIRRSPRATIMEMLNRR